MSALLASQLTADVGVALDRSGHLFEGHETAVLHTLDSFVESTPVSNSAALAPRVPRVFRGASGEISNVVPFPTAKKPGNTGDQEWAMGDSNSRPLPCEGSALTN